MDEIENQLKTIRDTSGTDATIAFLNDLLDKTDKKEARLELLSLLGMEYTRANKLDAVTAAYEQAVEEYPDDLNSLISLSEHIIWSDGNFERALTVSSRAVQLAKERHTLVRHALQNKARAAKKLGRYNLLEDILKELLRNEYPTIRGDIRFESDVVQDIPNGTVDANVIRKFLEKTRKKEHGA
jgi:tetratricopeptide (TPR) repeat protein